MSLDLSVAESLRAQVRLLSERRRELLDVLRRYDDALKSPVVSVVTLKLLKDEVERAEYEKEGAEICVLVAASSLDALEDVENAEAAELDAECRATLREA